MAPTPSRSQIKWPPKAFLNVLGYVKEREYSEPALPRDLTSQYTYTFAT